MLFVLPGCWEKKTSPEVTCQLKVLTYSSFASLLGPGKDISEAFRMQTGCRLSFIKFTENSKVKTYINDQKRDLDVIVGLDLLSLIEFQDLSAFVPYESFSQVDLVDSIKPYSSAYFVPIDWSPLTVIKSINKSKDNSNLSEVVILRNIQDWHWGKDSLSLQDPRVSTTGLYFLWWWKQNLNKFFKFSSVQSLSPSWSASYGLFQTEKVSSTFTYLTSLLYEWEKNASKPFEILVDNSGHPLQVEFVVISKKSKNLATAQKFIDFLLSQQGQSLLVNKNYMLPSITGIESSLLVSRIPTVPLLGKTSLEEFLMQKQTVLQKWKKASQ